MKNEKQMEERTHLDKAGIICAVTCLIHCLPLPLLAVASPTISTMLGNEWIHISLLMILIPMAVISFVKSKKIHGNLKPMYFGGIGITLLISAVIVEGIDIVVNHLEITLTFLGTIILIIAHVSNIISLKRPYLKENVFIKNSNEAELE